MVGKVMCDSCKRLYNPNREGYIRYTENPMPGFNGMLCNYCAELHNKAHFDPSDESSFIPREKSVVHKLVVAIAVACTVFLLFLSN